MAQNAWEKIQALTAQLNRYRDEYYNSDAPSVSDEKFKTSIKQSREDGMQIKMLSLEESGRPKIEFQSRRNLKAVAETKALRKKLGKFLADHFLRWKGSRQITVYDDFEPYSFFFKEQTPYGNGICGGVILHGRENLEKAYYGIHT